MTYRATDGTSFQQQGYEFDEVVSRSAVRDLNCRRDRLSMHAVQTHGIGQYEYFVEGCGARITYLAHCGANTCETDIASKENARASPEPEGGVSARAVSISVDVGKPLALVEAAARELSCGVSALQVRHWSSSQEWYVVDGCGQRATYLRGCDAAVPDRCEYVLVSRLTRAAPP